MRYKFHDKLIFRSPLRPLQISFSVDELKELSNDAQFKEAVFLSSPEVIEAIEKWNVAEVGNLEKSDRLITTLLKYSLRMHSRSTPFGLFAGCGVTNWNDKLMRDNYVLSRKTRLDMDFTCSLALKISKLDFIQPYIKYYPNNSIYRIHDSIRYIEYKYKGSNREYQITSVDNSEFLEAIIAACVKGAYLFELERLLISDDISPEEAREFITEITTAQIIVSEFEPSATGRELLSQIISNLSEIKTKKNDQLENLRAQLLEIDLHVKTLDNSIANHLDAYYKIASLVDNLDVSYKLNNLFQTDLFFKKNDCANFKTNIYDSDSDWKSILEKGVVFLNKFSRKESQGNLDEFKEKFHSRYEYREVPLLEAIDNEFGIGFGRLNNQSGQSNPLLDNLSFSEISKGYGNLKWNDVQAFLIKLLFDAKESGDYIIELSEANLNLGKAGWDDLPSSMSVLFNHVGTKDGKDILYLKTIGNASAINLIGRFAHGNDEIHEIASNIATEEQNGNPSVIFAEIVHLPENRLGNVILRPSFREYEIPYLSKSNLPIENQIHLEDLCLSIRHNRLYLRSKKHNKEVLPRLGNAHNYSTGLPIYQFLAEMQTQDLRSGLYFHWGVLKREFQFLPRVQLQNLILSPAMWNLKKEDLTELIEAEKSILINPGLATDVFMRVVKEWRTKLKLPKLIALVEYDNELLIDLENFLSVKTFISIVKNAATFLVVEFLFTPKVSTQDSSSGHLFTNEYIGFLQKDAIDIVTPHVNYNYMPESKRTFTIGSEWIYYKIYSGIHTADKILAEIILNVCDDLLREGMVDKWFFIRYSDPDFHLRLRLHITDTSNLGNIILRLKTVFEDYETTELIQKIQIDTYERELERYAGLGIEVAEDIFFHDSLAIVKILNNINTEDERWLVALLLIDQTLDAFELSTKEKLNLMTSLTSSFSKEFSSDEKGLKIQLDTKFRKQKSSINKIFFSSQFDGQINSAILEILEGRSAKIINTISKSKHRQQKNENRINDFLTSQIHMSINRLFKSKQRIYELVLYSFMQKTYASSLARNKL